jgi:hypothetical protein
MPVIVELTQAVDRAWEADEKGARPHLGASQVGKPCQRALVYGFRHAVVKNTEGRMLRLFNRGHREEPAIIAMLRRIGMEVQEFAERLTYHDYSASYAAVPWEEDYEAKQLFDVSDSDAHVQCAALAGVKLKQWAFSDVGGHHAGSTDGKARIPEDVLLDIPHLPRGVWFALEFKTYNEKSFKYLLSSGDEVQGRVKFAKPEHYSQMQEYMHYMKLPLCLYIAVCKNDDQWYTEVVYYDEAAALNAIEKARLAIGAIKLPARASENPTNQMCRFCDYKGPCHFGDPLAKSCRTCASVTAVVTGDDARWHCGRWNALIPIDAVPKGCDSWVSLTD